MIKGGEKMMSTADSVIEKLKGKSEQIKGEFQQQNGEGLKGGMSKIKGKIKEWDADRKLKAKKDW